ncbi:MAG: glycosyltransferase [Planctomycetota bacterium]
MRFLIATFGSHGDVHPFVGLAQTLQSRGHSATLVTATPFVELAREAGVDAVGVGTDEDFHKFTADPDVWHPRRGGLLVLRAVLDTLPDTYEAVEQRIGAADVVVASTLALGAKQAAEQHGIPCASVHLQPTVLWSVHAPPRLPGVPAIVNRMPRFVLERFYDGADKMVLDPKIAPELNDFRAGIGLPPVARVMSKYVHEGALSLGMWPDWFAPPQADWPTNAKLAGFPLYDEKDVTPMPEHLREWIDDDDPPIAFTPGSAMRHGRRFFDVAVRACQKAGVRGLLLTRHAENVADDLPPGMLHVPYAPFSQLLPRCAALVHHGGIGTMSQALAAGIPQLVMPMAHDQFDNAERIARLGVGEWTSVRRFRPGRVGRLLPRVITKQPAASALAERLAGVDGLTRAAELLEAIAQPATESANGVA